MQVHLENAENDGLVEGETTVGGVAGYNAYAMNVVNSGNVTGTKGVGGVIGYNTEVLLLGSNSGKVKGDSAVGGVTGSNAGWISSSFNTGAVQGKKYVGGVLGVLTEEYVGSCYNSGSVTGSENVGGIAGVIEARNLSTSWKNFIIGSLNMGTVKGSSNVGAIAGNMNYDSRIINSYALKSTASKLSSKDSVGAEFLTSAAMTDGSAVKKLNQIGGSGEWIQGTNGPILKTSTSPEVENNVFSIGNAAQLYWFSVYVNLGLANSNTKAELVDDIVLYKDLLKADCIVNDSARCAYEPWMPIGKKDGVWGTDGSLGFNGIFDGNGHTISGLFINNKMTDCDYYGFFGYTSGSILNLGIEDSYFMTASNDNDVGGIAYENRGIVYNSHFSGALLGHSVGGIAESNYGRIFDSYNDGTVEGEYVGGITCHNEGKITRSFNSGVVNGSYSSTGGIAGIVTDNSDISYVYNVGSVYGRGNRVGGLIGTEGTHIDKSSIKYAYNMGPVLEKNGSYEKTGSVLGSVSKTSITSVYVLKESADSATSAIAEMDSADFFDGTVVGLLNKDANTNVWSQGTDYPVLKKSQMPKRIGWTYQISNEEELRWFANLAMRRGSLRLDAVLVDDIVLTEPWTPISVDYYGIFDGQGHTVSDLQVVCDSNRSGGFFNSIGKQGIVKNLHIVDGFLSTKGTGYVGGIAVSNWGTIENCSFKGTVIGSKRGGIVASDAGSTLGNYFICDSACDSVGYAGYEYSPNYFKGANFVITAKEMGSKKFKNGTYVDTLNGGVEDLLWMQGKEFPYAEITPAQMKEGAYQVSNLKELLWTTSRSKIYDTINVSLAEDIVVNENVLKSSCLGKENCHFVSNLMFANFRGKFNGNGHRISGLYNGYLFKKGAKGSVVENLNVSDSYLNSVIDTLEGVAVKCSLDVTVVGAKDKSGARNVVGGFANYNRGTVEDIFMKGEVEGDSCVGGIVGDNKGIVSHVTFDGSVVGKNVVGGIVGLGDSIKVEGTLITNATMTGSVKGESKVGGIAGMSLREINFSHNSGSVVGVEEVGGIVGVTTGALGLSTEDSRIQPYRRIRNSYNTGSVTGNEDVGGIIGMLDDHFDVLDCYNTGTITGKKDVGGLAGLILDGDLLNSFNYNKAETGDTTALVAGYIGNWGRVSSCYALADGDRKLVSGVSGKGDLDKKTTTIMTAKQFKDSTVLALLQQNRDSTYWIQGMKHPVFDKKPVKSLDYSDKKNDTGIDMALNENVPSFAVNVISRKVQVINASVGSDFALLDMLGREIIHGRVEVSNFEIRAPRPGSYLLRVGSANRLVNIK